MGLRLLIVDDSSVMRKMIQRVVRMSGIAVDAVHEAPNGAEGLEALSMHPIDLALVDVNMPIMTGLEMVSMMRMNPATKDLPVLVISTDSSAPLAKAMPGGHIEFIHKPFTPEEVGEKIRRLIGVGNEPGPAGGDPQGGGQDF